MGKYRNRLDVIADMLSVASHKEGAKKTKIMYLANLSWNLLTRYLDDVLKTGLMSFENSNCYVLTEKGKLFLEKYSEYSKRHRKVEKQSKIIDSEKMILENMVFNGSEVDKK
jgi:predicted transcriptional regulator